MIINVSLKIKNYKCFNENPSGFDSIYPINVIIGKNNTGKSSILNIIQYIVEKEGNLLRYDSDKKLGNLILKRNITEDEIRQIFRPDNKDGDIPRNLYINHFEFGKLLINRKVTFSINPTVEKNSGLLSQVISIDFDFDNTLPSAKKIAYSKLNPSLFPFNKFKFRKVAAERNIIPELDHDEKNVFSDRRKDTINLFPDGRGATNLIQRLLNLKEKNRGLIEINLLNALNEIIVPDIEFSRILTQKNRDGTWEVYLEEKGKGLIAISQMGSGIKTILHVLLNIIVIPELENYKKSMYVFAFEELENNLHPSLQRRLFKYIKNYSKINKSYFFITTHSNIVIDSFGTHDRAQIIHVKQENNQVITKTITSLNDNKELFRDLDIKASDILQSNGVIWVEGPSDRIYLKKWLEILYPELREGFHYSIMFYGGRLLSNLTFDYESLQTTLIPLLKINKNAFVLIDRDGEKIKPKLNATKRRIQNEIGNDTCWITRGREIENYLPKDAIAKWLLHEHNEKIDPGTFEQNLKLEDYLLRQKSKIKYNSSKSKFSSQIVRYLSENDLNIMDLKSKIKKLANFIDNWNHK